jgi:anti-sigma regulatory factor (Ser/Thr protein kinase)
LGDTTTSVEYQIGAAAGTLSGLTAEVDELSRSNGWESALLIAVQVSLDEVLSNVLKYYGGDESLPIRVSVRSHPDRVNIAVADRGAPFNPLIGRVADAGQKAEEMTAGGVNIGGRGIGLVQSLMDDVVYERVAGENHLLLLKYKPIDIEKKMETRQK